MNIRAWFSAALLGAALPLGAATVVQTSVADFSAGLYSLAGATVTAGGGGDVRLDAAGDDLQSSFSTLSALPAAEAGMAGAAWNGRLYVAGGHPGGVVILTDNASTQVSYAAVNAGGALGSWSAGTVLPAARSGAAAAAWNGRLYVSGGGTWSIGLFGTAQTTVWDAALSPTTGAPGSWSVLTVLPAALSYHGMAAWNGRLYVTGGDGGSGALSTVYYADIASDGTIGAWTTASNALPDARAHHGTVAWNGKLYVVGGVNAAGTAQNTVYYAPINADGSVGTWTAAAGSLPAARSDFGLGLWNGRLYVLGGTASATVFMADIAADGTPGSWTSSSRTLPAARQELAAAAWAGNVYALGGRTAGNTTAAAATAYGTSVASPTRKSPVGTYLSSLIDLGTTRYVQSLSWTQSAAPAGSSLSVSYSTSANGTATPLTLTSAGNGVELNLFTRYVTYQLFFQRGTDDTQAPVVTDVTVNHFLDFFNPSRTPLLAAPSAIHRSSATLSWTDRSLEETRFLISYATFTPAVGDQAFTVSVAGSSGTTVSPTLTGLSPNTTYYVRVRGFSSVDGSSGTYSNEVSFVTQTPLQPVLGVQAPGLVAAGAVFGATVTVRDDDGNVYTAYPGHISVVSSDPQFVPPAAVPAPGGTVFLSGLSLKTAGLQLFAFTDDIGSTSVGTSVTVGLGSGRALRLALPGSSSAGAAFASTVTATDLYGNLDAGFGGTVHFTSTDGGATLPADTTLSGGSKTVNVTLFAAGAQGVTASVVSGTPAASTSAVTNVGPASGLRFLRLDVPSTGAADTVFTATATVRDAFGNLDTAFAGTLHFSSNDPGSPQLPPDGAAAAGVRTATMTLNTPGSRSITVDDLSLVAQSTTAAITLLQWRVDVQISSSATAGVPVSVLVRVMNGSNVVQPSYAGTVRFTSGDGRAWLPADGTLSAGQGTFSVSFVTVGGQVLTVSDLSNAATPASVPVSVDPDRVTVPAGGASFFFRAGAFTSTVTAPSGAFPGGLGAVLGPPASCPAAVSAAAPMTAVAACFGAAPDEDLLAEAPLRITLGYRDQDVTGLAEGRLVIARYDPGRKVWVPLLSSVDAASNLVTAETDRLGTYQIVLMAAAADASGVRAWPNPFSPGAGRRMAFTRLPAGARLRLYAFSGELVRELSADDAGMAWWDGENGSGGGAASGTYFLLVEGGGSSKTLKVQVQR